MLRRAGLWECGARAARHPSESMISLKRSDILKAEPLITTGCFNIPILQLPDRFLLERFQPSQGLSQILLQELLRHQRRLLLRAEEPYSRHRKINLVLPVRNLLNRVAVRGHKGDEYTCAS